MSKDKHAHDKDHRGHHDHDSHGEHQGPPSQKKIHHDWRFWVSIMALVLMLLSMVIYVVTFDESEPPGGGPEQPEVPAAGE